MARTVYVQTASGLTIYAKPSPLVEDPWGDDVVEFTENDTTGEYSASIGDQTHWAYVQGGVLPADNDKFFFYWDPTVVAGGDATQDKQDKILQLIVNQPMSQNAQLGTGKMRLIEHDSYNSVTQKILRFPTLKDYTDGWEIRLIVFNSANRSQVYLRADGTADDPDEVLVPVKVLLDPEPSLEGCPTGVDLAYATVAKKGEDQDTIETGTVRITGRPPWDE